MDPPVLKVIEYPPWDLPSLNIFGSSRRERDEGEKFILDFALNFGDLVREVSFLGHPSC